MTTAAIKPAKQDRTTMALLFIAALVAVGGIGFAVGHLTAPSSSPTVNGNGRGGNGGFVRPSLAPGQTFNAGQLGSGGNGRGGFGGIAGGSVEGTVQSINGTQLTLKLSTGSTVTIDLSGSTTYHNETSAAASDVQSGSTVIVQIDTSALTGGSANPGASGNPGNPAGPNASGNPGGVNRTFTAKDVLITAP